MKKSLSCTFNGDMVCTDWKNACKTKVSIPGDNKLREFSCKLLNNILVCGYIVNKWNPSVKKECFDCKALHTVEHMLFSCRYVTEIWKFVESTLNVKIRFKDIVLGYGQGGK